MPAVEDILVISHRDNSRRTHMTIRFARTNPRQVALDLTQASLMSSVDGQHLKQHPNQTHPHYRYTIENLCMTRPRLRPQLSYQNAPGVVREPRMAAIQRPARTTGAVNNMALPAILRWEFEGQSRAQGIKTGPSENITFEHTTRRLMPQQTSRWTHGQQCKQEQEPIVQSK